MYYFLRICLIAGNSQILQPFLPCCVNFQFKNNTKTQNNFSLLTAPADYTAIARDRVTLGSGTSSQTVTVPIINDNHLEGDENFTARLVFKVFDPQVVIQPPMTRVIIRDDDSEHSFLQHRFQPLDCCAISL